MLVNRHIQVLVVDDHGTMRRVLRSQLQQLGFLNVDEASSGSEALVKLRKQRYGLIFSDWHMEEVTGLDLLKTVRGDPGLHHLPFIMVTSESRTENVIAARKAGVDGYIVKPFDPAMLKAKIEVVFTTRSCLLPGRKSGTAPQALNATPAVDATHLKFPGRFTSNI